MLLCWTRIYYSRDMKKWLLLVLSVLAGAAWTTLFVRSWFRESASGFYLMTTLWGVLVIFSFVSVVFRIQQMKR
jgi:hypothetical protein